MARGTSKLLSTLALVILLNLFSMPAAHSKGGVWSITDRDGYVMPGQAVRANAFLQPRQVIPDRMLLIPDWDWNAQPRRIPDGAVDLGPPSVERVEWGRSTRRMMKISFRAPVSPGVYGLVACLDPCRRLGLEPGATSLTVVESALEVRLRKELASRDTMIDQLLHRSRLSRSRIDELEDRVDEQLLYLSKHITRIERLETQLNGDRAEHDPLALAGIGLTGGVVGFAVARARRGAK